MPEGPRQLPSKKEVMLALLQGPSVFVHLDPRVENVLVPDRLRDQPQLVLQIGRHMAVSIPDLEVSDDEVTCTLSFNRVPSWCRLPWTAIYALVSEEGPGMVWPEYVPPEVAVQMQAAARQPQRRAKPKLTRVPEPEDAARTPRQGPGIARSDAGPTQEAAAPKPADRGLRAVPNVGAQEGSAEGAPSPSEPGGPAAEAPSSSPHGGAEVVSIRPYLKPNAPNAAEPASTRPLRAAGAPESDLPGDDEPPDTPPRGPTSRPVQPQGKKRRELPPYLRVIK